MIKVKFWDKVKSEYDWFESYLIDGDNEVFTQQSEYRWGVEHYYLKKHDNIEPHFFINDKRIGIENEAKE